MHQKGPCVDEERRSNEPTSPTITYLIRARPTHPKYEALHCSQTNGDRGEGIARSMRVLNDVELDAYPELSK